MKTIITVCLIIGLLLICLFIYLEFLKSKCTTKITGKFLKANSYTGYGNGISTTYYAPVFQYNFNDIAYEKQSFQSFSKKYIEKNFISGKNYNIYINSNKPKIFIVEKKFQLSDLLFFLIGFFMVLLSFLGFLAL